MAVADIMKKAIADGTRDLIRHHRVEDITVTQICETTGVNRRSFYRYFRDKFDVINWIYYHDALIHFDHYDGWSIFDYMPRIMSSLYADRQYYLNALRYQGQNSFRDYCTGCLQPLFQPHYAGVFSDSVQLEFFIRHLCEMTYDACVAWLSSEPCKSPQDFTAEYADFLVRAFSTSSHLLLRTPAPGQKTIHVVHAEPARQNKKRKDLK